MVRTVRKWMRKPATAILLAAGVCTIVVSAITLPVYVYDLYKLIRRDPPKVTLPPPPPVQQTKNDPPPQPDPPVTFHAPPQVPSFPVSKDRVEIVEYAPKLPNRDSGYYWELVPRQGDGDDEWEAFRRKCRMNKNPPMACHYPQRERKNLPQYKY